MTSNHMELTNIAQWAKIFESLFKVIAIVIAGFWTWRLFIKNRKKYPRATVGHEVEFRELEGNKNFLRLSLHIENTGEVLLEIASVKAWVQQVLPLKDSKIPERDVSRPSELEWPLADDPQYIDLSGKGEIEPGESDAWHFDFLINSEISTCQLYTYVSNLKKGDKEIGWAKTTVHDNKKKHKVQGLNHKN